MDEDQNPDRPDDEEREVALCSMCRREVPVEVIAVLMGRPVCLDCAASFFEEDGEEE